MGIFFFYQNRKPRPFEHKPIYWDPKKEKREKAGKNRKYSGTIDLYKNTRSAKNKRSRNLLGFILLLLIVLILLFYLLD